jgi:hypothetical protein
MIKILTAVTLAALIGSPAKAPAAAFRMGSEVLTPAGGALQSARWEVDPPDTGSVIIECGPSRTRAGLEARVLPAAFPSRAVSRPTCPRLERGTLRDQS